MSNAELGHILYHPSNILEYDCPLYIVALLDYLANELDRVMWNKNQKEYDNPFYNSGNVEGYKNSVFEVHAFDWNEENEQLFNFKYEGIMISWYKHLGRDTMINCEISKDQAVDMFNDCIKSIIEEDVFYEES